MLRLVCTQLCRPRLLIPQHLSHPTRGQTASPRSKCRPCLQRELRYLSSERLTMEEHDAGITEYTTVTAGFCGILKHRYEDFQVFEIDASGKTARITTLEPPQVRAELAAELSLLPPTAAMPAHGSNCPKPTCPTSPDRNANLPNTLYTNGSLWVINKDLACRSLALRP